MIDCARMLDTFLQYVQIDSETGNELAMGRRLAADLEAMGCEVTTDEVQEAAQTDGFNVYATLFGDPGLEPILFSSHMDTVVPGKGVKPVVCEDGYVRSDGTTVLGGDDKAGICAIMAAMRAAAEGPHRTVEAVFTVREESGMYGAKNLDYTRIRSKQCVVLDSGDGPDKIVVGAPGQNHIEARIIGRKAHAGLEPEKGVSAIQVGAHAVAAMNLLRIDEETTCNIGTFHSEGPTNIVSETARLAMEVRSRNTDKLNAQTDHMVGCLKAACERFGAELECTVSTSYLGYMLGEDDSLVARTFAAVRSLGLEPETVVSGGGSDANVYNEKGIAAVNLGVGMEKVHTTAEQLCIRDMENAARVCLELMRPSTI